MKLSVSQVEIYDDDGRTVAQVSVQDVGVVNLTLQETIHNADSWRELADVVAQAIKMMEAE